MTGTDYIIYGGVTLVVMVAFFMGRTLDQSQSNKNATWKTGSITGKTLFQCVVLGLVGGPLVYIMKGGQDDLLFCIGCMAAAPLIVDLLRPTVTIHKD